MTIKIFGGSFNPITNAHISIIEPIMEEFGTPKIIVSTENPFKDNLIAYDHRLNMVELAMEEMTIPHYIKSHTYYFGLNWARHIKKKYNKPLRSWQILEYALENCYVDKIEFLFGEDIKAEIESFEKIDYIKSNASIRWIPENNPIHATEIRALIKAGDEKWKEHVPSKVAAYIELHNLYKD